MVPGLWSSPPVTEVSILLFTGLQFDVAFVGPHAQAFARFNPTFYRITIR